MAVPLATQQARYANRFVAADTVTVTHFPLVQYEYSPSQKYRAGLIDLAGTDYPFDAQGVGASPKGPGQEVVRFLLVNRPGEPVDPTVIDYRFDDIVGRLRNGGLGKLYTVDAGGTERWAYAKLNERPGYSSATARWGYVACAVTFTRLSDWFGTTAVTGTVLLTSTPQVFTITNSGNARVRDLLLTLSCPLSATGFNAPQLYNAATAQQLNSSRVASTINQRLRLITGQYNVGWSTNNGGTYTDDYTNLTLPAGQTAIMELDPGDNIFTYTNTAGAPNASLAYQFYPAYH